MEHVFAPEEKLAEAFATFVIRNATGKERNLYSISSVIDELVSALQWKRKRYNHNTIPGYDIEKTAYDSWLASVAGEEEEEEDEDEEQWRALF